MPALTRSKTRRRLRRTPLHLAFTAACLGLMATGMAQAAHIVVTSPGDGDPAAPGTCTLRQAILSMNAGAEVGQCVRTGDVFGYRDRITFAVSAVNVGPTRGVITLTDSSDTTGNLGGTLVVNAGDLVIDALAWRGPGLFQFPDGVTIQRGTDASHAFGILRNIAPAGSRLTLKGLALRNGRALPLLCNGRGEGGGICTIAADLRLLSSRVSGNSAALGGGGIAAVNGTIALMDSRLDANVAYAGGGLLAHAAEVTVTRSTFDGNGEYNVSHGGAIHAEGPLTLVASTLSGNLGKRGAAIHASGSTLVIDTTMNGNDAYYHGGGLYLADGAVATLTGSSFHGNTARYNGGAIYVAGTLQASNCTIAGNSAMRNGAGIVVVRSGVLQLDHLTVTRNASSVPHGTGGGIGQVSWPDPAPWTGSATINASIIAGNQQGTGIDLNLGSSWSGAFNLISSPDALLGPLQDNGGATPTILPEPGSAALDAIAPQDCTQALDQRGVTRPQGAGCDVGAVEVAVDAIFVDGFDGD